MLTCENCGSGAHSTGGHAEYVAGLFSNELPNANTQGSVYIGFQNIPYEGNYFVDEPVVSFNVLQEALVDQQDNYGNKYADAIEIKLPKNVTVEKPAIDGRDVWRWLDAQDRYDIPAEDGGCIIVLNLDDLAAAFPGIDS